MRKSALPNPPKISLIVTTYNQPAMLNAVLLSLVAQTISDFEILVADDGSTSETDELIAQWQLQLGSRLVHVKQPDDGFRAAQIRNKAAAKATGNYLIFIDGDCLCPKNFIARHLALAEIGYFVAGNRILCNKTLSETILQSKINYMAFSWRFWLIQRAQNKINSFLKMLYLPFHALRRRSPDKWQGVKTCNLGVWRDDIILVNGFDEAFVGWGFEDSDLVVRMLQAGIKHKSGRFAVGVFHLWHPENTRQNTSQNWQRFCDRLETLKLNKIDMGINQYL